jgi:hypothetical protein
MITQKKVTQLSQISIMAFVAAMVLALCATPQGESPFLSVLELTIGWKQFYRHEGLFWLIPRTIYLLAVWCGLRSYIVSKDRLPETRIAGALAFVAVLGLIGGFIFLPTLSD